jgi:hypothetical protein
MKLFRILRETGGEGGGGAGGSQGAATGGGAGSAAAGSSIVGGASGTPPDWRSGITDPELRGHPSLKDIKDVDGLAKTFVNQGKLLGANRLEAPSDKWDETKWNDFYGKTGRPETPDKYGIERPKDLPQGVTWDEALEKDALSTFHKAGLNPRQAKMLMDWHNGRQINSLKSQGEAFVQARTEGEKALKETWGEANMPANLARAKMAANVVGGEGFLQHLEAIGAANDPKVAIFLEKVGRMIGEDQAGGASNNGFTTGPDAAAAEIEKLRGDESFLKAYNDQQNPGHKAAQDKLRQLYAIKNQGKPALSTGMIATPK